MTTQDKENIQKAEILLPSNNLVKTLQFFIDELGFKMESIAPAENLRLLLSAATVSASG